MVEMAEFHGLILFFANNFFVRKPITNVVKEKGTGLVEDTNIDTPFLTICLINIRRTIADLDS